jgi:choline kinase
MIYLDKNKIKDNMLNYKSSIKKSIEVLNETGLRVIIVVDSKKNFLGIITDGDIRREVFQKNNLKSKIITITNTNCLTLQKQKNIKLVAKKLLFNYSLVAVPVLKKRKILGIYSNLSNNSEFLENNNNKVVIMAGGKGTRLSPLTENTPKGLLKYKGKTLLENIIQNCKKSDFKSFIISINFLGDKIINYFKKKKNISFIKETKPLGTIGSLRLIKKISRNFLVLNCDVITELNMKKFINYHIMSKSIMTIGIKKYKYQKPYGEVLVRNNLLNKIQEKPFEILKINSGIYAFNSKIIPIIRKNNIKNIDELIILLKKKKIKINAYYIKENWIDLGQREFFSQLKE